MHWSFFFYVIFIFQIIFVHDFLSSFHLALPLYLSARLCSIVSYSFISVCCCCFSVSAFCIWKKPIFRKIKKQRQQPNKCSFRKYGMYLNWFIRESSYNYVNRMKWVEHVCIWISILHNSFSFVKWNFSFFSSFISGLNSIVNNYSGERFAMHTKRK